VAQTKISIPPAKVEFSSLSSIKPDKLKVKKLKNAEKQKKEKLRRIQKEMKEKGKLPKDSINFYKNVLNGLSTQELDNVLEDLEEIDIDLYTENLEVVQTEIVDNKERIKNLYDSLAFDEVYGIGEQTEWLKSQLPDSFNINVDTLSKEEIYRILQERTEKLPLDTARLSEIFSDSLFWDSDLLKYDSLGFDTMNVESNPVSEYFENFINEKIHSDYDLPLTPFSDGASPVKQFIPSLEGFNFKKPEIPSEKLFEALAQKELEEKKQWLTQVLSSDEKPEEKRTMKERFQIGGYFQYIPSPQSIELTPSLAYKVTDKWRLGIGYTSRIELTSSESRRFSYRTFTEYDLSIGYYLHLESEWISEEMKETLQKKERVTYLGLGKSLKYKFLQSDIQFLYNFNAPNQLQSQRFVFRFGINFTK
jgi:hypothetical protein